MQAKKNTTHYLTALGLFILLKLSFRLADNNNLAFLLKPTDTLVRILTGSYSVYSANNGYYHEKLNILIDKSCSGFNFWILCFLLFAYLAVKYCQKPLHKTVALPVALVFAYLLTIFVNSSRIFVSITLESQTKNFMQSQQHFMHEAIGILIHVSFLVLAFYLTEKFLRHKHHAKIN